MGIKAVFALAIYAMREKSAGYAYSLGVAFWTTPQSLFPPNLSA